MTVQPRASGTRAARATRSAATRRAPLPPRSNGAPPSAQQSFAVCSNGHRDARASWPSAHCLGRVTRLKAAQLARRLRIRSSRSYHRPTLASLPPTPPTSPPPRCAYPPFLSVPAPHKKRSSFRHVRSLFEEQQRVELASTPDSSRLNVSRFNPPARPPHTRPDPRKCRAQDRQVVRDLFHDLNARVVNSPAKLEDPNDRTVYESDSIRSSQFQTVSNTEILHQYADTVELSAFNGGTKVVVEHSDTEAASELEPEPEGSYAQYHHGHKRRDGVTALEQPSHLLSDVQHAHRQAQEPASEELQPTVPSEDIPDTFDDVAQVIEKEIHSLQPVSAQSQIKARLRNLDRKASVPYQTAPQPRTDNDDHTSNHDHGYDESDGEEFDEAHTYNLGEEDQVEEESQHYESQHQAHQERTHKPSARALNMREVEYMKTQYRQQKTVRSDAETSLGPPPMFSYRPRRLSRNVADAMAHIWEKFWKDDVRLIARIINKRLSQLAPYFKRFIAHVIAFWGSVTYIRRALAAFIRILNRDERVRELLQRIGWASATTLKIFLSICSMLMSATLQFYHLMRDRIIPDVHRVIPIAYYKLIQGLLRFSDYSPWSLMLGPFSFEFGIDNQKLPDPYLLHDKLGISRDDVTFATVKSLAHSIRQTVDVYRTRRGVPTHREEYQVTPEEDDDDDDDESVSEVESHEYAASESTPVHSQSTDEDPYPAPSMYSGPQYHKSSKRSKSRSHRHSLGPLTEKTNQDDSGWHRSHHKHRHTHHQ
ncbi:hypothetical protein FGB62_321g014 [Gracilaria domingensis]|nr:hypothetical protein FGB62_321g014 [Gracilaria domingensis]